MPSGCRTKTGIAESYVYNLTHGIDTAATLKAITGKGAPPPSNLTGLGTWNGNPPMFPCPMDAAGNFDPSASPVGHCWLELADKPNVIGFVIVAPNSIELATPHFHREKECYHVQSGAAAVWADGGAWKHLPEGQFMEVRATPLG